MRSWRIAFLSALVGFIVSIAPAQPAASVVLQDAVFAKPYKVQLSLRVSGFAPFTFSVVGGAPPACLHLSPDGVLSGTPANACRGTYAFTVAVIDQKGNDACMPQRFVVHVTDGKTTVAVAPVPQSAVAQASVPPPVPTPAAATPPPAPAVPVAPAATPQPAAAATPVAPPLSPTAPSAAAIPAPVPAAPPAPASKPAPPASAAACPAISIDKVTAGDQEVTASNATANTTYLLFDWPAAAQSSDGSAAKGASSAAKPVQLASATAGSDGTLDFKPLSQSPAAGDTVRILTADDAATLLGKPDTDESNQASVKVAAANPPAGPRVIVGYEQSGANSANSSGRLYVDIYYAHALRRALSASNTPPPFSLFGDVRIGSTAQNSSSTIGDFVAGIAGTASSIKINQIASVAEFLAGLEYSPLRSSDPKRARLSIFGEYGATGRLQAAELNNTYAFPVNTSQAYQLLVAAEKSVQGPNPTTSIPTTCIVGGSPKIAGVADNCMFVQFAQQQPYFDQEAFVGLKSISYFPGSAFANAAPAILSMSFGANHAVNRDMRFNAMRFEGLVPLAVPTVKGAAKPLAPVIYLFGNANLAIDHSHFPHVSNLNFISLNPATSVQVNNVSQNPGASNTYVIPTQPTAQEYYSIGVGVDLVNLWSTIFSPSKKSGQ